MVYQTKIDTRQERWLLSQRPENATIFQRFLAEIKSTIALKWWLQWWQMIYQLSNSFAQLFTGQFQDGPICWLYSRLTRNQEQNRLRKKVGIVESKICTQISFFFFFKKKIGYHICLLYFPLECYIEKAQRIVSGLGPSSTIVHAITGWDASLGATSGFPIDAFGDFRQLDSH